MINIDILKKYLLKFRLLIISIIIVAVINLIVFVIISFGMQTLKRENQRMHDLEVLRSIQDEIQYKTFEKMHGVSQSLSKIQEINNYLIRRKNQDKEKLVSYFELIKKTTSSLIVYLMDTKGEVIVSTRSDNYDLTGNNYLFRPYFEKAINGKNVVYPAIGVTTGERGLYFSSPVYDGKKIKGVIVIKHGLDTIDKILKTHDNPVVLISPEGIIFSTNRPDWRLKSLKKLSDRVIKKIKADRQFADITFKYLDINYDKVITSFDNEKYYVTKLEFKFSGWQLISFTTINYNYPLSPIQKSFFIIIIISVFIFSLIASLLLIINENRIQSEKKYKLLFDNTNEGIAVLSENLKPIFFNQKILDITGYNKEEFINSDIYSIVHENDRDRIKNNFLRKINGEEYQRSYELRIITKNNELKWLFLSGVRIIWDKHPVSLIFVTDVTVRKLAEKALRENEKRYRLLVEAMKEGLLIIDERSIITYVNNSFCDMLEKDIDEIIGVKIDSIFNQNDNVELLSQFGQIGENYKKKYQWEWIDKKNNRRTCLVTPNPIVDINNKYLGCIIIFFDMTEIMQLQDRLVRSEKMESIGRLAGGVAHDLNNILSGLVSIPDLLLQDIKEDNEIKSSLEIIKKSGEKAGAIVNDLLTLSRRQVFKKEVININSLINDILNSHTYKSLHKEHSKISINFIPDQNLFNISGSAIYLENAIMNLIINSMEAMPLGGEIMIQTENYLYFDEKEDKYIDDVILTIKDNGMGISNEDCNKIFEPFYSKKVLGRSGTGLGLAIVWATIKDHGGTISVISKKNKGTTFKITLPVENKKAIEVINKDEPLQYIGNGENIIVIDDVDIQRELAKKILKKLNYKSKSFSNGRDAINYLYTKKTDLILLDMILEDGMDGLEIYKKILEINPNQKVIIVSGFAEINAIEEAKKLGAATFVRKPYTIKTLAKAIWEKLNE